MSIAETILIAVIPCIGAAWGLCYLIAGAQAFDHEDRLSNYDELDDDD